MYSNCKLTQEPHHHHQLHSHAYFHHHQHQLQSPQHLKDLKIIMDNDSYVDNINEKSSIPQRHYESNSLPRRKCMYEQEEFFTYSLPRKDNGRTNNVHAHQPKQRQHYDDNNNTDQDYPLYENCILYSKENRDLLDSLNSNRQYQQQHRQPQFQENQQKRRFSYGVPDTIQTYKKPVYHSDTTMEQQHEQLLIEQLQQQLSDNSLSDDVCSTCEMENALLLQEREIFIDFKPKTPSPKIKSPVANAIISKTNHYGRKKFLQKTHSEGEILINYKSEFTDKLPMGSSSEGDLKTPDEQIINNQTSYIYKNDPIEDEDIFDKKDLLKIPSNDSIGWRNKREAFRKRSISLDEPINDDVEQQQQQQQRLEQLEQLQGQHSHPQQLHPQTKSNTVSPLKEELSVKPYSAFPSNDSLAKDHSDEIWNESQTTVLHAESG